MTDQPFFWPALMFLGLGLPLVFKLVPRNPLYGIRTRASMASDAAWYRTNRIGGLVGALGGAWYLLYAWRFPAPPGTRAGFDFWNPHFWPFVAPLVVGTLLAWLLGRR